MAVDHRESFGRTLFGARGDNPDAAQRAAMTAAKQLIYAGLPRGRAGILVDERYGQPVIRAARRRRGPRRAGRAQRAELARAGVDQSWLAYMTANHPDFAKVLVRDKPAFPGGRREQQQHVLRGQGVPLIFELLVPATGDQLAAVGGQAERYDRDLRPSLVTQVIADHQAAGIEPAIWKVEGLETADAARAVVSQIRAGGRH